MEAPKERENIINLFVAVTSRITRHAPLDMCAQRRFRSTFAFAQSDHYRNEILGSVWIARKATFIYAGNEDSEQTVQVRRLIRDFVGRTYQKGNLFFTLLLLL